MTATLGGIMYGMSEQFLAHTAFAVNQYACIPFGYQPGLGKQILHDGTLGNNIFTPGGLRYLDLRYGPGNKPESLANVGQQSLAIERFGQITEYASLDSCNSVGNGAVRR